MRAFLLLAALIAAAPPAEAFVYIRGGAYGKGERPISNAPVWTNRVVRFHVNTNMNAYGGSLTEEISGAQFLESVQHAVNAWAESCRSDLRIELAGTTTALLNPDDQINLVIYDNRTNAQGNEFQDTQILAAATSVMTTNDEFFDCDILVNGNSQDTFKTGNTIGAGEIDLRSVLTHEIGHCLGLDHPVEPPTYTSSNPLLNQATMVQSAVVGQASTIRRDINQDDRDGLDCIYERGLPLRSGTRCSSYHGTNGKGQLSGAVTGGAQTEITPVVCGTTGDARTVTRATDRSGSGCMKSAVADDGSISSHLDGPWAWVALLLLAHWGRRIRVRLRLRQARSHITPLTLTFIALPLLLLAQESGASDLRVTAGYHTFSSKSWNRFSSMDSAQGVWSAGPAADIQKAAYRVGADYELPAQEWGTFAVRLEAMLPRAVKASGVPQGESAITKTSRFWGVRAMPLFRFFLDESETFFLETGVSLGSLFLNQKLEGGTSGELSASSLEVGARVAAGVKLLRRSLVKPVILMGYDLSRSGHFTASKASGTVFGDFRSGDRLALRNSGGTEEFRMNTSGFFVHVGVSFDLTPPRKPAIRGRAPAGVRNPQSPGRLR